MSNSSTSTSQPPKSPGIASSGVPSAQQQADAEDVDLGTFNTARTSDFQDIGQALPYAIKTRYPIMFRGLHGTGKSEMVYQIADEVGLEVIERRASQMTEGDVLGLPVGGNEEDNSLELEGRDNIATSVIREELEGQISEYNTYEEMADEIQNILTELQVSKSKWTAFLPPKWLYLICKEPYVFFVDELDRATLEVRQAFFELGDSRKLYGNKLHEDTLIFSACNSGVGDGMGYQTMNLDPAESDRWIIYDVQPTINEWLSWASEQSHVPEFVMNFIADHPDHLEETDDYEPGKRYPSRRSWERLGEAIHGDEYELVEENPEVLEKVARGFVGLEAAASLKNYAETYEREKRPEDIVYNGEWADAVGGSHVDQEGLARKFKASDIFFDIYDYGQDIRQDYEGEDTFYKDSEEWEKIQQWAHNFAEYAIRLESPTFFDHFVELMKMIPYEIQDKGEPEGDVFQEFYEAETSKTYTDEDDVKQPDRIRDKLVRIMINPQGEEIVEAKQEEIEEEEEESEEEE